MSGPTEYMVVNVREDGRKFYLRFEHDAAPVWTVYEEQSQPLTRVEAFLVAKELQRDWPYGAGYIRPCERKC